MLIQPYNSSTRNLRYDSNKQNEHVPSACILCSLFYIYLILSFCIKYLVTVLHLSPSLFLYYIHLFSECVASTAIELSIILS